MPDTIQLLFEGLLSEVMDEVYVVHLASMQVIYVSQSVLEDIGCDFERLKEHSVEHLLGVSDEVLKNYAVRYSQVDSFVDLSQLQTLSTVEHNKLKLMVLKSANDIFILAIKNKSLNDSQSKIPSIKQFLNDDKKSAQPVVSNTPWLAFQFQLDGNGEIRFIQISDGCKALLGLDPESLKKDVQLLYAIMNARDRIALRKHIQFSATHLSPMTWEGRVWIDGWQDNKWLDMRAVPRVLSNGAVQWDGIITNITQSKNAKHQIEQSRRELAELTTHIHKIKEKERAVIAREIHDDLGGNLTAIKIGLSSVINKISKKQEVSIEQVRSLEEVLDNTFEAVHKIASDLRPNVLDLGIIAALEWQAKEFEKQLGITCNFTSNQNEITVTADQGITLFRVFQESMSNIVKHANATKVSVSLIATQYEIMLKIADNGIGIKSIDKLKPNSFGLRGMSERVTALNGTFNIGQFNQQGTEILIKLPIE